MSDQFQQDLDRRQFLLGGAAGVAATAGSMEALAGSQLELWASAPKTCVILHDPRIQAPHAVLQRLDAQGARRIALEGDPVWFWRSAAGAPLRDPATSLIGVTGWAELLVFRGLAAETRRHLRYEKFNEAAGAFIWMIA